MRYLLKRSVKSLVGIGAALTLSAALFAPAAEEAVPKPDFNRIDYAHPQNYLDLPATIGSREKILAIASTLKRKTPEDKLLAVGRWLEKNLRYDDKCAYAWRNFDAILEEGKYGGCADHAVVFGALTRACGIPCVWVKTMDLDWIREFRANEGKCAVWRGHVYLEVYIHDRWALLDATQLILYDDYKTTERILPGSRWAYDKGGDPYELILSVRWETWKKQTAAHFRDFDLKQLPFASRTGTLIGDRDGVFIAADNPIYHWAAKRCADLGYSVRMTFNTEYGRILPRARGNRLIVTCVGGRVVFNKEYYDLYLPWSEKEIAEIVAKERRGVKRGRLEDGTRVYLVFAEDREAMQGVIDRLTLE